MMQLKNFTLIFCLTGIIANPAFSQQSSNATIVGEIIEETTEEPSLSTPHVSAILQSAGSTWATAVVHLWPAQEWNLCCTSSDS